MPLTLSIGLSKKVGLPDFGSLGANCQLEIELDCRLLHKPEALQQQIQQAYAACRQAVENELAQNPASGPASSGELQEDSTTRPPSNGSRTSANSNGHRASSKQIEYAQQLAGQIRGLGVRRLEALAAKLYNKPLADLNSLDASGLIDTLKAIKGGTIDVATALDGAAS